MTDMENVIVGLTDSIEILSDFDTQEYTFRERQQLHGSVIAAIQDALALLKAQEPIAPEPTTDNDWVCGNCAESLVGYSELDAGGFVTYRFSYCPNCGRAVKWR